LIEALKSALPRRVVDAKGEDLLTPRENQVVGLVAEGIGNREIAEQLGVKENTVKKSLLRIYDKVGVSNRVELVLYVLTHRSMPTGAPNPAKMSSASERFVSRQVEAEWINPIGTN
jgi:DNA-binding NarL/FixJ family response regulator